MTRRKSDAPKRITRDPQVCRAAVLELTLAAGVVGVRSREIAARAGISMTSVQKYLRALHISGEIGRSTITGTNTLWGSPGIWDHYGPARDATAPRRARRLRRKERELRREMEAESDADQPKRAIVAAATARPLRCSAPASVWAYAQGMA